MGGKAGWWLVGLGGVAILLAAWQRSTQSDDARAVAALLTRAPGLERAYIAFGDCPQPFAERLQKAFAARGITLRTLRPSGASPDEAVVAAFMADADTRLSPLPGQLDAPVLFAWCKGDAVHLQAVEPQGGRLLGSAHTRLFDRPSHGRGRLHITSRPTGARVLLDYRPVGETPLTLSAIQPGNHHLRLVHPLAFTVEEELEVNADRTSYRLYRLEQGQGFVAVTSEPAGATVSVGGQRQVGATPLLVGPLPAGIYRWEVRHPQAGTEHGEVAVPSAATARVAVRFPDANAAAPLPWRDPLTGMEFIWVAGGCFAMGCGPWTDECLPDEIPHEVCVDGFWMGRHEVTRGQWQRVMAGRLGSFEGAQRAMNQLSWDGAVAFITHLNTLGDARYRLPTEAEWEFACRSGGAPQKYAGVAFADEQRAGRSYLQRFAWVGEGWQSGPFPVGQKRPNGVGLYDMSGNVWEWVADTFHPEAYLQHHSKNPLYSGPGEERMARGGSWFGYNQLARCSHRYRFAREFANADLGLRLVRIDCGAGSRSGAACR